MAKIIGIQGIAGSGKTTVTQALGKALEATTLFWDDFDPIATGPSDYVEWFKTSKDLNDWKYDALAETLQSLKEGKSLTCQGDCTKNSLTSLRLCDLASLR